MFKSEGKGKYQGQNISVFQPPIKRRKIESKQKERNLF